jgi:transcriptional repressor NrdR
MRCPFCRRDNDRVTDTRGSEDGFAIRRRRQCNHCKRRFTTYERLDDVVIHVVKKDDSREPFDREKIRRGLERACWKRPVSAERLQAVVDQVEAQVYEHYDREVPSQKVGELVMRQLAELDQVAYVRFASVYREFRDARDFVIELRSYLDSTPNRP